MVLFEFDAAKNQANLAKHGLGLAEAEMFDFDKAIVLDNHRRFYGELRQVAIGY